MAQKELPKHVVRDGKLCAVLCYLFLGLLWYALDKHQQRNKFANFHAKEGLLFYLFLFTLEIIGVVVPYIGRFVAGLGGLVLFILGLIGLYYAFTGRRIGMPYLTELAQKIAI